MQPRISSHLKPRLKPSLALRNYSVNRMLQEVAWVAEKRPAFFAALAEGYQNCRFLIPKLRESAEQSSSAFMCRERVLYVSRVLHLFCLPSSHFLRGSPPCCPSDSSPLFPLLAFPAHDFTVYIQNACNLKLFCCC